jgi:hypothetical protein
MTRPPRNSRARPNILVGILRVARGRRDGLTQFGSTPQAFLASLAPLVAFPLVGGVMMVASGAGVQALTDLFATACALLAPPALSFELARFWGREAHWLRFATAFNWCQWILPLVGSALLIVLSTAIAVGLSEHAASVALIIGLGCYALWMHCFLARYGLDLPAGRAALLVLGVNLVTVLLVVGPRLLTLTQ